MYIAFRYVPTAARDEPTKQIVGVGNTMAEAAHDAFNTIEDGGSLLYEKFEGGWKEGTIYIIRATDELVNLWLSFDRSPTRIDFAIMSIGHQTDCEVQRDRWADLRWGGKPFVIEHPMGLRGNDDIQGGNI